MKSEIEAMRAVMMTGAAAMDRAHHDSANDVLDARVGTNSIVRLDDRTRPDHCVAGADAWRHGFYRGNWGRPALP